MPCMMTRRQRKLVVAATSSRDPRRPIRPRGHIATRSRPLGERPASWRALHRTYRRKTTIGTCQGYAVPILAGPLMARQLALGSRRG